MRLQKVKLRLRPEVLALAELMEERLQANEDKGGWRDCTSSFLYERLCQEAKELIDAVVYYKTATTPSQITMWCVEREAADVANFAMMIADNIRKDYKRRL